MKRNKGLLLLLLTTSVQLLFSQELPERTDLFTRTPNGTYRIHATTEAIVTGKGKVDLLICQPCPESNRYQDVIWLKDIPSELRSTYDETGHPYVKFAKRVDSPTTVEIDRDYVVNLYKVKFNWDAVNQIYAYDKTAEEYARYTRRYPCDIVDTNAYDAAYSWVSKTSSRLKSESSDALMYIKKAYATVTTNFTYGPWPGGFTNLIARKQGDCGGISTVFVCLLREGGIPAREMVCIRPDNGPHVWTEFYLQNYGWISADPTFDLGRTSDFQNFGNYWDNTIVMTYDSGFTVSTAGGIVQRNVFVQNLAWWWYWWWEQSGETARNVSLNTTWDSCPGMITKDGSFVSSDELWNRFNSFGIDSHVAFVFDCNYSNVGTNQFTLWNGQNCSYVKSPLGYAFRLDHDDGAWTDDDLKFGEDWTILTIGKFVGVENDPLFCIGSSWTPYNGFVLASGKTNEVTLSFWQNGSRHTDLIAVGVSDSAVRYHAYAIRAHGLDVSLYVDGVKLGTGRFPVLPPTQRLQVHAVHGGVGNTGLVQLPGGCLEDWRLYNALIPDEMIMAYADLLFKHDESCAGEPIEGSVIPHAWIEKNCSNFSSYEAACKTVQANGLPLWQSYVAGLVPTNAESKFTASIEIVNGEPKVSFDPDLGNARKYTVKGSKDLGTWEPTNKTGPFFRVYVEIP